MSQLTVKTYTFYTVINCSGSIDIVFPRWAHRSNFRETHVWGELTSYQMYIHDDMWSRIPYYSHVNIHKCWI